MKISLIVAMAQNHVIGRNNQMPWHLSEDLQYFKRTTMGKPLIMGRNTFESIGKALPGRTNIVVSRNSAYAATGIQLVNSLDNALQLAAQECSVNGASEVMVMGGAQIYTQALALADRLYLTQIHANVEGDTYFPPLIRSQWQEIDREDHTATSNNPYHYSFLVLERKSDLLKE